MRLTKLFTRRSHDFILECFISILLGVFWFCLYISLMGTRRSDNQGRHIKISSKFKKLGGTTFMETSTKCRYHHNCFDVYRCSFNVNNIISVYTYPASTFFDSTGRILSPVMSREYMLIIQAIKNSAHHTSDISRACLIVPPVDTLSQSKLNIEDTATILNYLPSWKREGTNHLIFNMLAGEAPEFNPQLELPLGKAMIAGAGMSSLTYRPGFDISLPIFNALTHKEFVPKREMNEWFFISSQTNYHLEYQKQLKNISLYHSDMLFLELCTDASFSHAEKLRKRCKLDTRTEAVEVFEYPEILQKGTFCLVVRGVRLSQTTLLDSLMMGCIPVVFADTYIMPFSEVIDWQRASVILPEDNIGNVYEILKGISLIQIADMRKQIHFIWENYFSSVKKIVLTTLKIISDRVYSNSAWKYQDWNAPLMFNFEQQRSTFSKKEKSSLVFIPLKASLKTGFTAIVLTYNRLDLVFQIINLLGKVPSLRKLIVLWNNKDKPPPQANEWPSISKPIKVLQMKYNRLSNRFFPFKEITTEAVLQLDDDILNLSPDDIEFGYQTWREFPDRLVGFPGRAHYNNNSSLGVEYSADWDNDITMVLTGAAFHHKMYSHIYTYMMQPSLRRWVDEQMNCEDIAMNFVISNNSGKAPVKVTPRKRFKCQSSEDLGSLCGNPNHEKIRSKCIKEFGRIFGTDVLKQLQFRADPVLMHENLPKNIVKFKNVGEM